MSPTILVIEDNEQNAYLVKVLLQPHGYRLEFAMDGIRGLEMAAALRPALILLDIQLPGMDGYAAVRWLRKIEGMADVPIIAVTSYAMVGDRERAIEAGCTGHIEKPIAPETFAGQIAQFLRLSTKPDGAPEAGTRLR
jgi:two-component system cell cycle response regulator DivK